MVEWPQPDEVTIPVSSPSVSESDIDHVVRSLRRNDISRGPSVREAEDRLSESIGIPALTVSNGSVALMLSLRALGVGPGDEVLVPALTYAATASAVVNVGATPVLCDSNVDDWTIDVDSMMRMATPRTRAVIPVHLYGVAASMSRICDWARAERVAVIEDAAEALGGTLGGSALGTFGDVGTWSFFGNKVVTCGEGGAVASGDEKLLARLRLLRGQGMDPNHRYWFLEPGFNFRLSNLSASLLASQLTSIGDRIASRERIFARYRSRLQDWFDFQSPPPDSVVAPWLFTAVLKRSMVATPVTVARHLAGAGIETRPIFYPLNSMPAFRSCRADDVSAAADISARGLSFPTFPELGLDAVDTVCDRVLEVVA